jgi:predicted  nucleic acid-binding Zn-ribbon protein
MAYQKRGLRPPEFTKTSVSEEDEREWVESALKVLKEKIKKLERKLNNVKDEQEKKRLRKNIRKITQDMAEIANKELIEQALRGL